MPKHNSNNKQLKCFVCDESIADSEIIFQKKVNLPVCTRCNGSKKESEEIKKLLEGLADGFVCGCI